MMPKKVIQLFDSLSEEIFYEPLGFTIGRRSNELGERGDQAENLAVEWIKLSGRNAVLAADGQRGFDILVDSEIKISIKQRSYPGWHLDGLWPSHYESGLVHGIIIFETEKSIQILKRIIMLTAESVFKNEDEIYFSEFNRGRGQLTMKKCIDRAHKIISL